VLGTALTPALVAERLAAQFPLARLAEFCIGICIGHFVVARVEQRSGNSTEELAVSMAVRRRLGAMGIASMLALGLALGAAGSLRQTSEIVVNSAFAAPLFAVLVVSLALGVGPHVRLLSSRAFIRLGTASYALYIIQDPFAWWWHRVVHLDLAQPMWLVMFLTAIIATSMACERWIEVPARELLLRHAPAQRRRTDTTLPLARSCDTSAEASVESLSPTIVMHSAWSSKSV
jgi:peptidoglycan/LPS O-acetylase OafA/YrhL